MKMISTFFAAWFFINLSTANAQAGEMASNNTLTGKEHLPYSMVPEFSVWKDIAGFNEAKTDAGAEDLKASYNKAEKKITVEGTDNGGDIEVWDVNGNTMFDKASKRPDTVLKVQNLKKGTYYVHYNNGTFSEGVKLSVR